MAEEVKGAEGAVDLSAELEKANQLVREKEDQLAVLSEERDNYKNVALKRKGKLEADDTFFGEHDEADIEKTVAQKAEQVKRERETARQIEQALADKKRAEDKLAEVIRAKDNKPAGAVGGSSGGGQEVKDGVFSEAQIAGLESKWTKMGFNEEQKKRMLETEKKNALARRAL